VADRPAEDAEPVDAYGHLVGERPPDRARAALYRAVSRWNSAKVRAKTCSPQPPGLTT
jgi:hypothetical protein